MSSDSKQSTQENCRIVIDSIGNSGMSILGALAPILGVPEYLLAAIIYRAPSEFISNLPRCKAEKINKYLRSSGLESRVISIDEEFKPGDSDHEIAVTAKDPSRMRELGKLVIEILGVEIEEAAKLLCSCPTILCGKISASTARTIKRRCNEIGVECDISFLKTALFDIFLADCTTIDRNILEKIINQGNIPELKTSGSLKGPIIGAGLKIDIADALWKKLSGTGISARIINRDFQRYDLLIEKALKTREMIDFLTSTTRMPEHIAANIPDHTPIVTHQNICFQDIENYIKKISRLGGRASGQLIAFQRFYLKIERAGDLEKGVKILQTIAGYTREQAIKTIKSTRKTEGSFTAPQAKWLKWELEQTGTETSMFLL